MKFFLIDHSLRNAGGHHYDYAALILRAAEQAGWQPVLATGRQFQDCRRLPSSWRVLPIFPHHVYSKYSAHGGWRGGALGLDGELLAPAKPSPAGEWLDRTARSRRIRRFAAGCQRLFRIEPLRSGDQVFLTTCSDFDLLGLVRFLAEHSETAAVDWHLQFHFNILEGREAEYHAQGHRLAPLQRQFAAALAHIPTHRLHFYTTTRQLAAQYNALGVAEFRPLSYPIDEAFHRPEQRAAGRPLRVTFAGAVRSEKGQQHLSPLLAPLWKEQFQTGRLQLVIQSKRRRVRDRPRQLLAGELAEDSPQRFNRPSQRSGAAIVAIRHPLPPEEYRELIRSADIGLLLYDGRCYYSRHAGILGEYLSAGVPVVVPAGCWLSEQISDEVQAHLEELLPQAEAGLADQQSVGIGTRSASWSVAADASDVLVEFACGTEFQSATFVRLVARQFTSGGRQLAESQTIVACRTALTRSLIHLQADCAAVRLDWSNAYADESVVLLGTRMLGLAGERIPGGQFPSSRVGLIAAANSELAGLLTEMSQHYGHYRSTATQFSRAWHKQHRPQRTLESLLAQSTRQHWIRSA